MGTAPTWFAVIEACERLVRPLVTVLFASAIVIGFLDGKVSVDAFMGVAGLAIGFWFQGRSTKEVQQEAKTPPPGTTSTTVTTTDAVNPPKGVTP